MRRRAIEFTPRQSEILALAATGLADKEIAARLQLSLSTVRTHLRRIYRAHGLRNRTEAVATWVGSVRGWREGLPALAGREPEMR